MKTAKEWMKENEYQDGISVFSTTEIEQIQLDAYKQGMTDAAYCESVTFHNDLIAQGAALKRSAILIARDNKTSL